MEQMRTEQTQLCLVTTFPAKRDAFWLPLAQTWPGKPCTMSGSFDHHSYQQVTDRVVMPKANAAKMHR